MYGRNDVSPETTWAIQNVNDTSNEIHINEHNIVSNTTYIIIKVEFRLDGIRTLITSYNTKINTNKPYMELN